MFERLRTDILPGLVPRHAKIMVAVSGGPDSMALAHILWRYMREDPAREISLVITHVHHGARKESDQEVKLVQQMAESWKVPCRIHRFDAKGYAKATGQSFQEAAREWRYARWQEDMCEEGCTHLATAHHLGDQAETILYRLLRGSGTAGLAGIYPSKDSIIRPLLTFTKADIFQYCEQEKLPYAIDASNEQPVYVRNRIRLQLIPTLERDYNPRLQEVLGRMGELLRWDEDYLVQQMETAWNLFFLKGQDQSVGLKGEVFKEPAAILSRLLRRAAMLVNQERRGLGYTYVTKIMASQGKPGWKQDLPGLSVRITEEGIWFSKPQKREACAGGSLVADTAKPSCLDIPLVLGSQHKISGLGVEVALLTEEDVASSAAALDGPGYAVAVFSKDFLARTQGSLVCRTRREGDKIWFQGVGHKSLKKVFQEAKIPAAERSRYLLIASGNEVLWIPGLCRSGLCQAEPNSPKAFCVIKPQTGHYNLNSL
ncbi:tRNA lysidine(34) synthetase TilS [Desulfosporosinus sp. PR]|uniref:tRNA lysidine(34) synthetase TilS n=1 Tax=Candidatus Desulfosporosinus nitrosoreducens TaxID=3401928 RepID=UPI0027E865AE|nr:tRNA lysidine(34) synthetase TilS [Desulfosporosinus sp. PR]MDQ7092803.1 tRNA lysidine(34) synthetase TilS [Desulfosporosinus sp. PR]